MGEPLILERALWYYPKIKRFTDADGNIFHNLLPYFRTWELEEWKKTRDYGLLADKFGNLWEFFYPDEEVEEELCSHRCQWCPKDCELRVLWDKWEQEKYSSKENKCE